MTEITLTIDTEQQKQAFRDSFTKLDPRYLVRNPVLFDHEQHRVPDQVPGVELGKRVSERLLLLFRVYG